jgi:type I restriction enzyme R subunit
LRELLDRPAGGVIFTTLQKFTTADDETEMPVLSTRRNVIVIADEAHRSQYGLRVRFGSDGTRSLGFAGYMRDALPGASFIGFTGTPIEARDANTPAVFGDYIDIYDIGRAVADFATVPIHYESRLARLELDEDATATIDEDVAEWIGDDSDAERDAVGRRWASVAAVVGAPSRLARIAADLVEHFEARTAGLDGKAMIVAMSRSICVDLYAQIIALRPAWHDESDERGAIKIVMTGAASDPPEYQVHLGTNPKGRRELVARRLKDPADPLKIVIVRDMWLTGFDAPSLRTMYVDKPMRGHGLMQAIARVNRVFRDKPGGLVVDYLGLADQLKNAMAIYTESGGKGQTTIDTSKAIQVLKEKYEVVCGILHGFDWSKWKTGSVGEKLALVPAGQQHVLEQDDGKGRFIQAVTDLSQAFALCAASEEAMAIRDDLSFFQTLKAHLVKTSGETGKPPEELDHAIRQLVSKAIVADGQIIDVFTAAGLKKPDISILSDQFLAEVKGLKHKNVAAELLAKLLKDEIKTRAKRNVVQSRTFSEMLEKTLNAYRNRAIATQEVIEELVKLAKQMRSANQRGVDLGLNEDEIAFYDALAANESAIKAMGDEKLKVIAAELVTQVRKSVTIDWTMRESARAVIRVMVRKILKKYGYPPDLQDEATKTVLAQAEVLCADWAK